MLRVSGTSLGRPLFSG